MSEYLQVKKPLLDQLAALGWAVIDHRTNGVLGIPDDPALSLRSDFH